MCAGKFRNYKTSTRPTFHLPAGREFSHGLALEKGIKINWLK
jgi:hypothetical protein